MEGWTVIPALERLATRKEWAGFAGIAAVILFLLVMA